MSKPHCCNLNALPYSATCQACALSGLEGQGKMMPTKGATYLLALEACDDCLADARDVRQACLGRAAERAPAAMNQDTGICSRHKHSCLWMLVMAKGMLSPSTVLLC